MKLVYRLLFQIGQLTRDDLSFISEILQLDRDAGYDAAYI